MKTNLFVFYLVLVLLFVIKTVNSYRLKQSGGKKRSSGTFFTDDHYSIVPLEFYERIDEFEIIAMYDLIFERIKFNNDFCNFAFQNCLVDTLNNNHVKKVSNECFPLKKSKFCLLKSNFADSEDCAYRLIHDKVRIYQTFLSKNLEACTSKFPNFDSTYLINRTNSIHKFQNLVVNVQIFLVFQFLIFYLMKM
ncbi:unnamed protein product [Brachionus calyciflorus]|uniref:Uncharacterized protein n=1 Tax=Brachionus calyciflorus TaxID=104777 RepID=A0A813M425_9BILA|nr:unnamed protein product [Brachionus calyciflorus]